MMDVRGQRMDVRGGACALVVMVALGLGACKPDRLDVRAIDGHQRLGDGVVPQRYLLELSVDPAAERFSGTVKVDVRLVEKTAHVRMHAAKEMTISRAVYAPLDRPAEVRVGAVQVGSNGGIAVSFDEVLPAGEGTLRLDYEAPLPQTPEGLYRVRDGGRWFAFTQFEPLEARRAFPCFDEPRFKTPFTVTLHTPRGLVAVANAPEREHEEGAKRTSWRFLPTRPLPTYLVAFAVGDFDVVAAPQGSASVPLRVIAPKGKGAMAQAALASTPALLKSLEAYFGMPYPYQKLDLVAVPNFAAGAMENVGLVTFREQLLLYDRATATPDTIRRSLGVIAHELAHMWFGNLVTPRWWDDLWLNESFATWMADRVVREVAPELRVELRRPRTTSWVMSSDSKAETRAIRQPITSGGDVYNAFDGITYQKGAAVLGMIEAWIGPEAFRDGLRALMKASAHGSVTTAKLMSALKAASGRDVASVLATFIDRPGVPLLKVGVSCAEGKTRLDVTQTRYLPVGSKAEAPKTPWRVPMCARYGIGDQTHRHCALITEAAQQITLPEAGCAAWVHPNADEVGYYQWSLDDAATRALLARRDALSPVEAVAMMGHLRALLMSKALDPKLYYAEALRPAAPDDLSALERLHDEVRGLRGAAQDLKLDDAYARLVRARLGPHLERMGLEPQPGDSPRLQALRLRLIETLGEQGEDPYVLAQAQHIGALFLEDPKQVPAYRAKWAVPLATQRGDAVMWDRLRAMLKTVKDPAARGTILRALSSVEDPALRERALALFLDDDVRSNEFWAVVGPVMSGSEAGRRAAWAWGKRAYDALEAKIGVKGRSSLLYLGSWSCSPQERQDVVDLFKPKITAGDARERALALMLESVDQCILMRPYLEPARRAVLTAPLPDAPSSK